MKHAAPLAPRIVLGAAAIAFSLLAAAPAMADDAEPAAALGAATPAPADASASGTPMLKPLCTDRPTKSTSPCTVDAGHFQLETDIGNVTFDHSGGADTTTSLYTNPTLKYGLSNTVDVELNISPFETIVSKDRTSHVTTRASGVGDLYGRLKVELAGVDGGNVSFGLEPYIKVPTASDRVGNGQVEGGVIAPISINLPANFNLVIDPEVDALKNAANDGHHANVSGLLSLSYPVTKTVTASAEIWGDVNSDPTGTLRQASFDLGAAWIPASSPNLQWDGGVNLGLNSATPAAQVYVGVSHRF
jgi:hypothetical protein